MTRLLVALGMTKSMEMKVMTSSMVALGMTYLMAALVMTRLLVALGMTASLDSLVITTSPVALVMTSYWAKEATTVLTVDQALISAMKWRLKLTVRQLFFQIRRDDN